jgi:ferredoxin
MIATEALVSARTNIFVKTRVIKRAAPRMCAATYRVTFKMPKENREATIECDSDTYILDAIEAAGVDLGFACTAG